MKKAIVLMLFFSLHLSLLAQIRVMTISGGCALDEVPIPSQVQTDDIDEQTGAMVNNLVRQIGIQKNFTIRKAQVKNALVTQENGTRLLLLNPSFVLNIKGYSSDWGIYFVLAHEIAHFMNNDPLEREKHTPEMEIAADKFAAVTLCRMGASLQDAKTAIELFVKEIASETYPTKAQRLFGIESGWLDAGCSASERKFTYDAVASKSKWTYAGKGFQLGYGLNNGSNYYKVCLSINASTDELKRIKSVRYYFLHDSFGAGGSQGKIFATSTDASKQFGHCLQIWGTFPLRIVIYYKEGKQKEIDYAW